MKSYVKKEERYLKVGSAWMWCYLLGGASDRMQQSQKYSFTGYM